MISMLGAEPQGKGMEPKEMLKRNRKRRQGD